MKDSLKLIFTLTIICLISALAVSAANMVTKKPIAETNKKLEQASIRAVLPGFNSEPAEREYDGIKYWKTDSGIAMIQTAPDGYAGDIELMLGFTFDGELYSYSVLKHSETPGLGSHIAGSFIENVKGRSLTETNWKVKNDGGDIEAITAATISSRAVCGAIERGTKIFAAILEQGENK